MPHRLDAAGQRTRERHEDDQSDDCDDDYHDDHLWVVKALARDHKCGGNVALAGTERHDALCSGVRSAEQPAKIGMIRPQLPHWAVGRGDGVARRARRFHLWEVAVGILLAVGNLGDFPAVSLPAVLGAALLCAILPTRRESRVRLRSIRRMLQYPA